MSSPFLEITSEDYLVENDLAFAIYDRYPVTVGHVLIITKRLAPTWFDTTAEEKQAIFQLLEEAREIVEEKFSPDGFNIGINCKAAAGQTVNHLHVHLIPRYQGDVDDPRGGVRHLIPDRGNYLADDFVPATS